MVTAAICLIVGLIVGYIMGKDSPPEEDVIESLDPAEVEFRIGQIWRDGDGIFNLEVIHVDKDKHWLTVIDFDPQTKDKSKLKQHTYLIYTGCYFLDRYQLHKDTEDENKVNQD